MKKTCASTSFSKGSNLLKVTQQVGAELGSGSRTVGWQPWAFCSAPPRWHHPPGLPGRSCWINEQRVLGCTSKKVRTWECLKSKEEQRWEKEVFRVINQHQTENTDQRGQVRSNITVVEWSPRGEENHRTYRARHGTEMQWILSERQPDVYDPASMVTPNLILPLLIDPKFNSKSSIAYLIYGFYGRLHEERGRAFVA